LFLLLQSTLMRRLLQPFTQPGNNALIMPRAGAHSIKFSKA
jgi:hypothetical protein